MREVNVRKREKGERTVKRERKRRKKGREVERK